MPVIRFHQTWQMHLQQYWIVLNNASSSTPIKWANIHTALCQLWKSDKAIKKICRCESLASLPSSKACSKYIETFTHHCKSTKSQQQTTTKTRNTSEELDAMWFFYIKRKHQDQLANSLLIYYKPINQSFTQVNQQSSSSKPRPFKLGQLVIEKSLQNQSTVIWDPSLIPWQNWCATSKSES